MSDTPTLNDYRILSAQLSAAEDRITELQGSVEFLVKAMELCHEIIAHMNPSAARLMKRYIECADASGEPVEEGAA